MIIIKTTSSVVILLLCIVVLSSVVVVTDCKDFHAIPLSIGVEDDNFEMISESNSIGLRQKQKATDYIRLGASKGKGGGGDGGGKGKGEKGKKGKFKPLCAATCRELGGDDDGGGDSSKKKGGKGRGGGSSDKSGGGSKGKKGKEKDKDKCEKKLNDKCDGKKDTCRVDCSDCTDLWEDQYKIWTESTNYCPKPRCNKKRFCPLCVQLCKLLASKGHPDAVQCFVQVEWNCQGIKDKGAKEACRRKCTPCDPNAGAGGGTAGGTKKPPSKSKSKSKTPNPFKKKPPTNTKEKKKLQKQVKNVKAMKEKLKKLINQVKKKKKNVKKKKKHPKKTKKPNLFEALLSGKKIPEKKKSKQLKLQMQNIDNAEEATAFMRSPHLSDGAMEHLVGVLVPELRRRKHKRTHHQRKEEKRKEEEASCEEPCVPNVGESSDGSLSVRQMRKGMEAAGHGLEDTEQFSSGDLCECICSVVRRNLEAAESILSSVNSQSVITSNGGSFDRLQPPGQNFDTGTVITLFLCLLIAALVYSLSQRNNNNAEDPAHSKHGRRHNDDDDNNHRRLDDDDRGRLR